MSDKTDELRFYGKYRAMVLNNQDPEFRGRILAIVPNVFGTIPPPGGAWAEPCVPFAGALMGFYAVPQINSWVWIEFERGDPEYPIWSGCFWGVPPQSLPLPAQVKVPPPGVKVVLQTQLGHNIVLDDTPGAGGIIITAAPGDPGAPMVWVTQLGITLQMEGSTIALTSAGVTITAPTVIINGTPTSINGTALVVT
jgi:hypothetical protein